jgi:hypothetical protein
LKSLDWAIFLLVAAADALALLILGLGAALIVTTVGRPSVRWTAEQSSRLSDPAVGTVTALIVARRRGQML